MREEETNSCKGMYYVGGLSFFVFLFLLEILMICNANTSARICVVKVENYDNRKLSFFVVLGGRGLQRRERQGCIFKVLKGAWVGGEDNCGAFVMSCLPCIFCYPTPHNMCFYHASTALICF